MSEKYIGPIRDWRQFMYHRPVSMQGKSFHTGKTLNRKKNGVKKSLNKSKSRSREARHKTKFNPTIYDTRWDPISTKQNGQTRRM